VQFVSGKVLLNDSQRAIAIGRALLNDSVARNSSLLNDSVARTSCWPRPVERFAKLNDSYQGTASAVPPPLFNREAL